jgi:hypothetical protein
LNDYQTNRNHSPNQERHNSQFSSERIVVHTNCSSKKTFYCDNQNQQTDEIEQSPIIDSPNQERHLTENQQDQQQQKIEYGAYHAEI